MTTPDYMPILSEGNHRDPRDGVCAMEAAAFLAGEPHSDHPECVHPVIAAVARQVNDMLPDDQRGQLWPLVVRSLGTADTQVVELDRRVLSVRLATWCARQVADLTADRPAALAAVEAAEAWADDPSEATRQAAATTATSAAVYTSTSAAARAATSAATYAAYAAAEDVAHAAEAAAYAAAYAAARADDDRLAILSGLIDHHASLTGRQPAEAERTVGDLVEAMSS